MSTTQQVTTENGAVSLATSGSARVDLFTKTVRGIDTERLDALLEASWAEDALHTLKILFYCRDCRGGKGERKIFYDGMRFVLRKDKNIFLKNMKLIGSMYGRWSDLLQFIDEEQVATEIAQLFADQLKQDWSDMQQGKPITLCAKWAPTENCSIDNKKHAVKKICAALGVDKKSYRKQYLVPLRAYLKVIETYMCAKEWSKIDYSKVPGVAMNKLKKAFEKNDKERFDEYRAKLQKGDKTVKVNAATVEAHELVSQYMRGTQEDAIVEAQWKEIVKRVEEMGSLSNSIVLSDVSGSMEGTPMQVSIALGLIISEVTRPPFQNLVITFHENPTMHRVVGKTLKERVRNLQAAPWGGTTNLQSAFDLILEQAKNANLSPDEMPTRLYIISDMQFNQADRNFTTNHETIKLKYRQAGYEMPQIVYWNVRANTNDVAAKSNEAGVALLGGFSTAMLKSVLNGKDFSPFAVMLQAIENERYSAVSI